MLKGLNSPLTTRGNRSSHNSSTSLTVTILSRFSVRKRFQGVRSGSLVPLCRKSVTSYLSVQIPKVWYESYVPSRFSVFRGSEPFPKSRGETVNDNGSRLDELWKLGVQKVESFLLDRGHPQVIYDNNYSHFGDLGPPLLAGNLTRLPPAFVTRHPSWSLR